MAFQKRLSVNHFQQNDTIFVYNWKSSNLVYKCNLYLHHDNFHRNHANKFDKAGEEVIVRR